MATFDRLFASAGDDCLPWPHAVDTYGYGKLTIDGRTVRTHVASCTRAHGEPATPGLVVAHSCRTTACMNPNHLRWATQQENMDDKIKDGTVLSGDRNPMSAVRRKGRLPTGEAMERRKRTGKNELERIQ